MAPEARHRHHPGRLRDAGELGVGAEPKAGVAEDAVASPEPGDRGTGRRDLAGELAAEDRLPRPAEAGDKPTDAAGDEGAVAGGFASVAVQAVDGGGADSGQGAIVPRSRPPPPLDAE